MANDRELDKHIERDRLRDVHTYSTMGPYGRSSARALCAVAGIVIGAFSCTKSDFFLAPVLGAVAGLCIGWFFGWGFSRAWHFLTYMLSGGFRFLRRKVSACDTRL